MTRRRKSGIAKRSRIIYDSDEEEIQCKASLSKRKKESQSDGESDGVLTPTTSEDGEEGWTPPVQEATEHEAYQVLLRSWRNNASSTQQQDSEEDSDPEFEMNDFTVYQRRTIHYMGRSEPPTIEHNLCTLDTLRSERGLDALYIDGIVSNGGTKRCIEQARFEVLSIAGYDDLEIHSATGVFIKTDVGAKHKVWLCLKRPSHEYERYHREFLWVADFGKHVVEFLLRERRISLVDFKFRFFLWVNEQHGGSKEFRNWAAQLRSGDFRVAFNRHFQWLWNEAVNECVDTDGTIREHPVWREADPDGKYLTAIPQQSSPLPKDCKTIVTPFVHKCFEKMYFGKQLQSTEITDPDMRSAHLSRLRGLGFPKQQIESDKTRQPVKVNDLSSSVAAGDVIGIHRDDETAWTSKGAIWFLYVTQIHSDKEGSYYRGFWLYQSQDTTMADMFYPYENELFMSDNCNCEEAVIRPSDIILQPSVMWSPKQIPTNSHFVRQTYVTGDQSFRTLSPSDFPCHCDRVDIDDFERVQTDFAVYDTVLVAVKRRGQVILEPCIIQAFDLAKKTVRARRLMRATRDLNCGGAKPHELVWTSRFFEVKAKHVVRKCHTRFWFKEWTSQDLPTPHNRNGQADCFILSKQLLESTESDPETIVSLSLECTLRMNQAAAFSLKDVQKLATLSLFSGGGNFDRGFEEAGALFTKWAVEWNAHAAHTYRANLQDPEKTSIFLGSVDEHLRRALAGQLSASVPAIGSVQALLAGSPCQGFSAMQPDKLSVDSIRNASKVATVASYIDLWRPKYAILENVPEMTRQLGHNKNENVFSQLLCCLVGMGYQVQQLLMDSWSYGEAQSRSRVFIVAVAPGLPLLSHPNITHAHPEDMPGKILGKAPNGQPFGVRYYENTAFSYVSAREATDDMPDIGDGNTHACLALPDHRPGKRIWPLEQDLIKLIPKQPRSQGLVNILDASDVPKHVARWMGRQSDMRRSEYSKSYVRLDPSKLFRTVTTALNPSDGKAGFGVHWEQDRVLTVMEARRAQGFPDHEVIIGDIGAQWKIIGNSVSRAVALALGMSLRDAVLATPPAKSTPHTQAPRHQSPFVLINQAKQAPTLASEVRHQTKNMREASQSEVYIINKSEELRRSVTVEADSYERPSCIAPDGHQPAPIKREADIQVHHHPSLTIRLSEPPARQFSKHRTTTIIDVDEDISTPAGRPRISRTVTPETPGLAIHQDGFEDDVELVQHSLTGRQPAPYAYHRSGVPEFPNVPQKATRYGILDGDDDDEVVYLGSRPKTKR